MGEITNVGTENQSPHVLTYKWELNDENVFLGGEHHTLGPARGVEGGKTANECWA